MMDVRCAVCGVYVAAPWSMHHSCARSGPPPTIDADGQAVYPCQPHPPGWWCDWCGRTPV